MSNQVTMIENTIYFYGSVNDDNVHTLTKYLKTSKLDEIKIQILSNGGRIAFGLAGYYEIMDARKNNKHITTINIGECNSSATIIFSAGTVRLSKRSSTYLIHPVQMSKMNRCLVLSDRLYQKIPSVLIEKFRILSRSTYQDFEFNKRMYEDIVSNIICSTSKLTPQKFRELCEDEKYLSPQKCLKYGLIDGIID